MFSKMVVTQCAPGEEGVYELLGCMCVGNIAAQDLLGDHRAGELIPDGSSHNEEGNPLNFDTKMANFLDHGILFLSNRF